MGIISTLNYFVFHAYKHGTNEDKKMARLILWNELKGIAICNFFVFMFAATTFRNYRNSRLLLANGIATLTGISFASHGVFPIFSAYQFHKEVLPVSIVQDEESLDFKKSTQLVNETLAVNYFMDLENAVFIEAGPETGAY